MHAVHFNHTDCLPLHWFHTSFLSLPLNYTAPNGQIDKKRKIPKTPTLAEKKNKTRYWLLWKILIADSSFWKQVFRCKRKAMIMPAANSSSFQNDATMFSHKAFNFAATYRWQVPGEEKREDYQAAIYFSSHTLTTHCSMLEVITCRRILYAVTHFSNYVSPSGGKETASCHMPCIPAVNPYLTGKYKSAWGKSLLFWRYIARYIQIPCRRHWTNLPLAALVRNNPCRWRLNITHAVNPDPLYWLYILPPRVT